MQRTGKDIMLGKFQSSSPETLLNYSENQSGLLKNYEQFQDK